MAVSKLHNRWVAIIFISISLLLTQSDVGLAWGSGSSVAETHQLILEEAYKKLQDDPAFQGSNFPSLEAILSFEGVEIDLVRMAVNVSGPGADATGNSRWSDHYYNPRTGKGDAPFAAADYYESLKMGLEDPSVGSISEKDAAYLAHFVADMSSPYHINGLPGDEAIERLNSENGKLPEAIVGPDGSEDWIAELGYWKKNYENDAYADWFDPWYWDGGRSPLASSHLEWEGTVTRDARGKLAGYSRIYQQLNGNGDRRNVEDFVRGIAQYTNAHQADWWQFTSTSVPDMLDQAITNVYTVWRSSFSALRPAIDIEQDPQKGSHKLIVKIKNLEEDEAARDVKVNIKIEGGTVGGPEGEGLTASSYSYPYEIPPHEEAIIEDVWDLKGSGDVSTTVEVTGTYVDTPDAGKAVQEITVSLGALPSAPPSPAAAAEGEVKEMDLGLVHYTQAPRTWTIDVPADFTKVEVGVYGKDEEIPNKYGGWNAYLKINSEPAWEFRRHDPTLGGIIYDYIDEQEVQEQLAHDAYLDVTSMIRAGENTITYYHYTSGDGIGVKVRIHTV